MHKYSYDHLWNCTTMQARVVQQRVLFTLLFPWFEEIFRKLYSYYTLGVWRCMELMHDRGWYREGGGSGMEWYYVFSRRMWPICNSPRARKTACYTVSACANFLMGIPHTLVLMSYRGIISTLCYVLSQLRQQYDVATIQYNTGVSPSQGFGLARVHCIKSS